MVYLFAYSSGCIATIPTIPGPSCVNSAPPPGNFPFYITLYPHSGSIPGSQIRTEGYTILLQGSNAYIYSTSNNEIQSRTIRPPSILPILTFPPKKSPL